MDVYGLTGGIGSGKSTVARLLEDFGVPVVSADELSRVVVASGSDGLHDVVTAFGEDVLDDAGELDRRKMAAIVFREPARRQQLESILHPRIRARFEQVLDALEKAGHDVAVYEVPLLFEKNLQSEMKATILVTASEATRIARVRGRDEVTETEVKARIGTQMPEDLKRKRADYIIENEGDHDALRREVRFMLERFLRIDARGTDEVGTEVAPATVSSVRSGGTMITPLPTSTLSNAEPTAEPLTPVPAQPSQTPTQVPLSAPSPPSSVGTMPPFEVPTDDSAVDPPPRTEAPAPPAPPPGVQVPTPPPGSLSPVDRPTPHASSSTEPASPVDAAKKRPLTERQTAVPSASDDESPDDS